MQYSPMEQYEIFPIQEMGISQPNTIGYLQIAGQISIMVTYIGTSNKTSQVPTGYAVTHESLFRSILQMVDTYMSTIYFPQMYTLFHIILFSNLIGMIPYSSTPTVEIIMTQSQAFTMQVGILILGFISHKLYLQAAFLPAGTPLFLIPAMICQEILAYITRTFSLGLRLAVNMITGHIQVKVCVSFIWGAYLNGTSFFILLLPIFLLTLFLALELLIAYLQAYIFTFITCITFKDMVYLCLPINIMNFCINLLWRASRGLVISISVIGLLDADL